MSAEPDDLRVLHRVSLGPGGHRDPPLPEVRRLGVAPPERDPVSDVPHVTAAMIDGMLWRSALVKLKAAKTCERAARTVVEARRVRAGRGTRLSGTRWCDDR